MNTINLLPIENQIAFYQQPRIKKSILLFVLLLSLAMLAFHQLLIRKEHGIEHHLVLLKNEIAQFNHFKKDQQEGGDDPEINDRRVALTNQRMLSELWVPHQYALCFTEISRDKNTTLFSGQVSNAMVLTEFFNNWPLAYLFSEIVIEQLEHGESQGMRFRFRTKDAIEDIH